MGEMIWLGILFPQVSRRKPFLSIFLLLYSLLLLFCVHGSSSPFNDSVPFHLYHSSDSLLREIETLVGRHPDKFHIETMRGSNRGYLAEIVVVTYNHTQRQINKPKIRILLSFGQHGRELITTEVALQLLHIFVGERSVPYLDSQSIENILDNFIIKVVPMENLNGRKLVEAGDSCDRRNGRGVDLNRNWSVDWGKKEKDYDPYEEYPGSAPFSEPEAQIMRKLAVSFNPHIWVSVHSGMEALFMPYDHKNTIPAGLAGHIMKSILENLNLRHFQRKCLVGSGGGSVGYLAHGTTTDYMYDIAKVPMAFTFEIYGDASASQKDCFRMFNPIDKTTFQAVIDKWCTAFITLFEEGIKRLGGAQLSGSDKATYLWDHLSVVDNDSKNKVRNRDVFELAVQELRNYFRLFFLSTVLLMFMFCSRISKNKFKDMNLTLNGA
ncbi:Zn-dependent exopeptidases superfamily protein [Rhynchospora pubera]|uniref:Zn-dependent exopeptidases superfamily protein n=1 Tax=Rhynchospora pubera TaxID=906938 RepID=A0AAV8DVM9_9POAL|nr:Zn-dependent exopeptidases superfamily protein [Rhynchospora pubera]